MLKNARVHPTLPAVDLDRASKFYGEKLGLKISSKDEWGITVDAGEGTYLYLYKRGATKADHTVAEFTVKDVEKEVKALKAKGVKFEDYDLPEMGIKTVDGIATMDGSKGAWFKDTEGNILAVSDW